MKFYKFEKAIGLKYKIIGDRGALDLNMTKQFFYLVGHAELMLPYRSLEL